MTVGAVVMMGVSGAGKTTVGQALAARLACPFFDADDFHSEANNKKMCAGIPLDDGDRASWLVDLHALITEYQAKGQSLVLACSALKKGYRKVLCQGHEYEVLLVYLHGGYELIERRMQCRNGHYESLMC